MQLDNDMQRWREEDRARLQMEQNLHKSQGSLACKESNQSSSTEQDFLDLSQGFSDFSTCSSDVSGELQRFATLRPNSENVQSNDGGEVKKDPKQEPEPCVGFLQRENLSTEIIESISPEDLQSTMKICIDGLKSSSVTVKRSAAAKLRLLAKNRADNRALIGESGAIPTLIPLLRGTDPSTQEHAVTALLNLSLHEDNKIVLANAGAIKSFVYVLKTGTETSKQNDACALLSLMVEENKSSIGACGAIPPLVALLFNGSSRGKKDALTTLYKLCSIKCNKDGAVSARAVKPLVALVAEQTTGLAKKAMVVVNSLAGIDEGCALVHWWENMNVLKLAAKFSRGSFKIGKIDKLNLLLFCGNLLVPDLMTKCKQEK